MRCCSSRALFAFTHDSRVYNAARCFSQRRLWQCEACRSTSYGRHIRRSALHCAVTDRRCRAHEFCL